MLHGERLSKDIEHARRVTILALFFGLIAFILFEALRGHHFWNKVKAEGNLWNYGSSLLYFVAGEAAVLNGFLIRYHHQLADGKRSVWNWMPWLAAGAAFTFFACDEMLTIHEKLGLAIEQSVPVIHRMMPGHADGLIMAAYGIGGIVFSIAFFRGKTINRLAKRYLLAAFIMIVSAETLDVMPKDWYIRYLPFRETEELLEVFAGWGFIAAFITFGSSVVSRLLEDTGNSSIPENVKNAKAA